MVSLHRFLLNLESKINTKTRASYEKSILIRRSGFKILVEGEKFIAFYLAAKPTSFRKLGSNRMSIFFNYSSPRITRSPLLRSAGQPFVEVGGSGVDSFFVKIELVKVQ